MRAARAIKPRYPSPIRIAGLGALLALVAAGAPGTPAAAQEELLRPFGAAAEEPRSERAEAAEPALPGISELVPRVVALGGRAAEAVSELQDVAELGDLAPRARELAGRQATLEERLDRILALETVSDDPVAALADEAEFLASQLEGAMAGASERVERLDSVRQEWLEERALWRRWRGRLAADPEYRELYADDVDRALDRVASVLEETNRALAEIAPIQQSLRDAAAANRRLRARARVALRAWRADLFRRTAPVLFTAEHRRSMREETWPRSGLGPGAPGEGGRPLEPRWVGVLFLQAVLVFLVGWTARRLRRRVTEESRWSTVLRHPWAIGVLVAAAAGTLVQAPLPPVGRLASEVAIGGATALVASGMFRNRQKRWAVYGVSAIYVLFAVLEAVAFPVPLLRVVLAGLAFAGAAVLVVAGRRLARSVGNDHAGFQWILQLGAVALGITGLAEVLGFHVFARWLLEASVRTAFVVFVVTFLLRLGRGALQAAVHSAERSRHRFLARVGGALGERLVFVVKLGLVVAASFTVASIWNLAESPAVAWRALTGAGISVGEWELTVGRVLVAVLAVYLAFLASSALRALLGETFFERRQFERGVQDSISTLVHYAIVVIGFFFGVSLLGFDLTNFALIAGALGVGIGFGLQNVVNNFVSGLILLFERPIRVGDVVVLGDEWGTVEKIGLRSTVIGTFNGAELIVPNGDLVAEKVTNWTLSSPRARLVLPVGADYGNDPQRVIALLEEVAREYPLALDEPAPLAIFTGFGESSLDFELRVWLGAFEQLLQARSELATAIVRRFAAEGVGIPFPQRDLHLRSIDPAAAESLARGRRGTDRPAPPAAAEPRRDESP